jgi:hypothetical protein
MGLDTQILFTLKGNLHLSVKVLSGIASKLR